MKNRKILSDMAQERIARLLELAKGRTMNLGSSDHLSKKYVNIARSIKTHYGIKGTESDDVKKMVCKKCHSILIPGFNASIRLASSNKFRVVVCKECGTQKHLFYK